MTPDRVVGSHPLGREAAPVDPVGPGLGGVGWDVWVRVPGSNPSGTNPAGGSVRRSFSGGVVASLAPDARRAASAVCWRTRDWAACCWRMSLSALLMLETPSPARRMFSCASWAPSWLAREVFPSRLARRISVRMAARCPPTRRVSPRREEVREDMLGIIGDAPPQSKLKNIGRMVG